MARPDPATPYARLDTADDQASSDPVRQAHAAPSPVARPATTPDAIPDYLLRHYGWAYLSPWSLRFFDRPLVINLVLFGQYRALMEETLRRLVREAPGDVLQLASVYGDFSPRLQQALNGRGFHLVDVLPGQIALSQRKTGRNAGVCFSRMDAASLAYRDNSLDTIILFFLLHELPPEMRTRTLNECLRVLKPGGRLLITEFSPPANRLSRLDPRRRGLALAEPWLDDFLDQPLELCVERAAAHQDKALSQQHHRRFGLGLYRVSDFSIASAAQP